MFQEIFQEIIKQVDLTQLTALLILAVFTPVIGILIKYLFIFIKNRIENVESGAVQDVIYFLVRAASQSMDNVDTAAKFAWVLTQVQAKFPKFPIESLENLIEAAVFDLKAELKILGEGKKNKVTKINPAKPQITG